jgi:hypothetical protein
MKAPMPLALAYAANFEKFLGMVFARKTSKFKRLIPKLKFQPMPRQAN